MKAVLWKPGMLYTSSSCDGCRTELVKVNAVVVGEEPFWESSTVSLCRDCTIEAAVLLIGSEDYE